MVATIASFAKIKPPISNTKARVSLIGCVTNIGVPHQGWSYWLVGNSFKHGLGCIIQLDPTIYGKNLVKMPHYFFICSTRVCFQTSNTIIIIFFVNSFKWFKPSKVLWILYCKPLHSHMWIVI